MSNDTPSFQERRDTVDRAWGWHGADLVAVAVIGIAVGAVFWLWNILWTATTPLFAAFPPGQAVLYGMWLISGVLGGLIIRKPGAALLTSVVAASVSAALGDHWEIIVLLHGALQGILPELVFLLLGYRYWGMGVAVFAAAIAGLSPAIRDNVFYNVAWPLGHQIAYALIAVASSVVIAGVGARLLTTALAKAGVLTPFSSARG
ncbi:ECF transporter S component [Nocardiopsis sp. CNT312]|uniref:ECF transporter S component n=1 Tax=Nocardiopsis sp. CNT312 TaxID=1137268 RepID=UPI00049186B1|nr:ECF transporter S component [Nocardiopsis sp. CNT312]